MTNPRLFSTRPERDPPPDSRPLDALRRELRQYVGWTAREAPLRKKRIAVACTTSTGEGFILHHWSLTRFSGYRPLQSSIPPRQSIRFFMPKSTYFPIFHGYSFLPSSSPNHNSPTPNNFFIYNPRHK